jgi:hypothetical protein
MKRLFDEEAGKAAKAAATELADARAAAVAATADAATARDEAAAAAAAATVTLETQQRSAADAAAAADARVAGVENEMRALLAEMKTRKAQALALAQALAS